MAGVDKEFLGEASPAKGIRIGHLPQEPALDPAKTVLGNVEEGVAATRALLDRFNAVSERLAEPMEPEEVEMFLEDEAKLQDRSEGGNALELDHTIEIAIEPLHCPPPG